MAPNARQTVRLQNSGFSAALPASLTRKPRLQVGQPDAIGPLVGVDRDVVRALVVSAIDEEPGRAGGPHFPESDFLLALHGAHCARGLIAHEIKPLAISRRVFLFL
jgi:hypothetical protein